MSSGRRVRLWLDELERMDEYSSTVPTGVCSCKAWKRRAKFTPYGWCVGGYLAVVTRDLEGREETTFYTCWYSIVLLQGPRRPNERTRLKSECTRAEVLSWRDG